MAKHMRSTVVLVKNEVTKGVDATPTAGANAILVRNVSVNPLQGDSVSRDVVRPYMGNSEQLLAGIHNKLDFEVELAGAGAAGDAPGWGPLLRACGFAETITAGTDVKYAPVTSGQESATIYVNIDGLFHKMTGSMGNVSFDLTAKGIPVMKYSFTGAYHDVADQVLPPAASVDFTKFLAPKLVGGKNTLTWSLHGKSGCLQSLQLDMANAVVWRALVGCEGVELTDRKPAGSVNLELGAVADKNWWKAIEDAVLGGLSITHGTVPGNIVVLDAPKVQLTNIQYADQDGILMMNSNITVNPNLGNDELIITVK